MKALTVRLATCALLAWVGFAAQPALAADTIKIGYVDPLSGPFASAGDQFLKVFNYIIDNVNAQGGALGRKFEIVPFDDKLQPSEALIALKSITDQNIPFVMQCVGSNVGSALIDAVAKNNARNPDNRVIYLNCGALATELTNEKCDFWQFRFTGSVQMRAYARIKTLPESVKQVYLLNQDYLFGQSIQHDTLEYLAKLRPDIKIVGNELMPFGQVQDFSPYITKIKASGAQSLITGNYNRDLNLLIKAGNDAGLNIRYDTYLAHLVGGPTAIGAGGADKLTSITEYQENVAVDDHNAAAEKFDEGFRADHDFDFSEMNFLTMFKMLAAAIDKAKSTDPLQVALALEGMHMTDLVGQENIMRKEDHQMLLPYYEVVFTKGVKYDSEHTGLGWKTETMVPASELALPTTCKMKRPAS
jgi:branched-chain amino acid transport system substrate-binding protein